MFAGSFLVSSVVGCSGTCAVVGTNVLCLHLQTMVDAFDCSHAVLRAAYDISEGNVERWLMMLQDR